MESSSFISALWAIGSLCLVFMVHESGHLLAARLFNIRALRVVFGSGRPLWTRTDRHGTCWSLHVFPFGGHVQLSGQGGRHGYDSASPERKALIVAAGPLANFGFAVAVMTLFFYLLPPASVPGAMRGTDGRVPFSQAVLLGAQDLKQVTAAYVKGPSEHKRDKVQNAAAPRQGKTPKTLQWRIERIGLLSVFIGLFNLLPFPGMDGYFLLSYALEKIVGPQRARILQPYAWRISLVCLGIVMTFFKFGIWTMT